MEVLEQYRLQLERDLGDRPRDASLHHRIAAVRNVENRIRLLSRGGMRVIEGGKGRETVDGNTD